MNKKIMAVCIIGMFLLTGVTTLSVGGMKASVSASEKQTQDNQLSNDDVVGLFGVRTLSWEPLGDEGTAVRLHGGIPLSTEDFVEAFGFLWDKYSHPLPWTGYCHVVWGSRCFYRFHADIYDLNRGTTYYYRAIGAFYEHVDSLWHWGVERSFRPGVPYVDRRPPDIGTNSATLYGILENMGGAKTCEVWFEYAKYPGAKYPGDRNPWSETPSIDMSSTGEFTDVISFSDLNLERGTTYDSRSCASNDLGTVRSMTSFWDVPKNKAIQRPFQWFLQNFLQQYPILFQLLQRFLNL